MGGLAAGATAAGTTAAGTAGTAAAGTASGARLRLALVSARAASTRPCCVSAKQRTKLAKACGPRRVSIRHSSSFGFSFFFAKKETMKKEDTGHGFCD